MLFLTLIFNHLLGLCILEGNKGNKEGQGGGWEGGSRKGISALKCFLSTRCPNVRFGYPCFYTIKSLWVGNFGAKKC